MSRRAAPLIGLLTGLALVAVAYSGSANAQNGSLSDLHSLSASPASTTVSSQVSASGTGDTYVQDDTDNVSALKVRMGISHSSPMRAGLLFTLNVPQGAVINAAYLTVRQTYASGGTPTLTIRAEASDNATPYTSDPKVTGRTTGQASVSWTPNGSTGTTYDSVDFSAVVQEVVNRANWSGNHNLSILVDSPASGSNAYIEIAAAESAASSYRATLTVSYQGGNVTATPTPTSAPPTATPSATATTPLGATATQPAPGPTSSPSAAWRNTMHHPGIYALVGAGVDSQAFPNTAGNFVHYGWWNFEGTEGQFDWHLITNWVNRLRAQNLQAGIDIVAFNGRGGGGLNSGTTGWVSPAYLYNDPTAYVANSCDGFRIPMYWGSRWLNALQRMTNSLASEVRDDPAVEFIAIGSGLSGETWPINSSSQGGGCNDLQELKKAGLTEQVWETALERMVDIYVQAFSSPKCVGSSNAWGYLCKPLLMQDLPYPDFGADTRPSRQRVREYAASMGVGDSLNSLEPERQEARYTSDLSDPDGRGDYDHILNHLGQFPVSLETYPDRVDPSCRPDLPPDTLPYWTLVNGLDKHVDYLRLQYMWFDTDTLPQSTQSDIAWASHYMGVNQSNTPSVWSVLRDYGRPYVRCNPSPATLNLWSHPQTGDFSFYLYHFEPNGGVTLPVTNDPDGTMFTNMGTSNSANPHDPRVPAGKEGWSARRTDQANGNSRMYFDIDDQYLHGGYNTITVTVSYANVGTDTWSLHYDGQGGDTVAGTIRKTNTKTWKQAQFVVSNPRLANSLSGGDLYIDANGDGDEIIHMVDVTGKPGGASIDVPLSAGWNLIGIPLQPFDLSINSILGSLGSNLTDSQAWGGCQYGWQSSYPSTSSQANPGMAMFVQVKSPTTLRVQGAPAAQSVTLCAGWNVVGFVGRASTPINQANLPSGIQEIRAIANTAGGSRWLMWTAGFPTYLNSLQSLQPGQGYYVRTSTATTWRMGS